MNLWVNRLGQLSLLAVALFFFSCEDENKILGYKNPNIKFEGKYVEIPLNTSVFLLDSVRTSNMYFRNEFDRLLVGAYYDGDLSTAVQSHGITEFYNASADTIPLSVLENPGNLDSISINLQLDYYTFGTKEVSTQTITVYEVAEQLDINHKTKYSSYAEVPHKPNIIAQKVITVDPKKFRDSLNTSGADPLIVRMKVQDQEFKDRLWNLATRFSEDPLHDTAFVTYELFKKEFPGLYFESSAGDKVVLGITLAGSTGLTMHYHTAPDKQAVRPFLFQGVLNYSNIRSTWDGVPIKDLAKYSDLTTAGENRIIQGGTGIVTRVSLDNFYAFATSDTVHNIIMNSAQFVIDDVVITAPDSLPPPGTLGIRWLNNDNKIIRFDNSPSSTRQAGLYEGVVTRDYIYYDPASFQWLGNVTIENNKGMLGVSDASSPAILTYSSKENRYSGFSTILFQRLYRNRNEPERFNQFVLYPVSSAPNSGAKSLSRTIFPGSKVSLRIYYTEPTVNTNE